MSAVERVLELMKAVDAAKEGVWISAKILHLPDCTKETAETIVQEAVRYLTLVDDVLDATRIRELDDDFRASATEFADRAHELGENLQALALQKLVELESAPSEDPEQSRRRVH